MTTIAMWLGFGTHHANNLGEPIHRDSCPNASRSRGTDRAVRARRRRGAPEQPQLQLGGHDLERCPTGWRCRICDRRPACWAKIAPERCNGSSAVAWAEKAAGSDVAGAAHAHHHVLFLSGGILWCDACGAYAGKFAVGLARPRRGKPLGPSQRAGLRQLREGRHPRTRAPFRDPAVAEPSLGARRRPLPPDYLRSGSSPPRAHAMGRCLPTMTAAVKKAAVSSALRRSRLPEWYRAPISALREVRPAAAARLAALRQRVTTRLAGPPAPRHTPPDDDPTASALADPPGQEGEADPKRRRLRDAGSLSGFGQYPTSVVASPLCAAYDIGHLLRDDVLQEREAKRRRLEADALPPAPPPHLVKRGFGSVEGATSDAGSPTRRPRLFHHAHDAPRRPAGAMATVSRGQPRPRDDEQPQVGAAHAFAAGSG